jgi:hypothetical protein
VKLQPPLIRVVEALEQSGYVRYTDELLVRSVRFDFSAVMLGRPGTLDLVLIVDTLGDRTVPQRVEALGRTLDLQGSKRSLTSVLVGPPLSDQDLQRISRVSRVLELRTPTGAEGDMELADALAPLLPVETSPTTGGATIWQDELALLCGAALNDLVAAFTVAAENGQIAVTELLATYLGTAEPGVSI